MNYKSSFIIASVMFLGLISFNQKSNNQFKKKSSEEIISIDTLSFFVKLEKLQETAFRFPVGDSLGKGYYIAQKFQDPKMHEGYHLGIDVSGIGKANTDLGDTIYSVGNGLVNYVEADNVEYLSVYHRYKNKFIKIIYAHCDTIFCKAGDYVNIGEPIATIGNSDGLYLAHLHLEAIEDTTLWFGGYGDPEGFLDPESILPFQKPVNKNKTR